MRYSDFSVLSFIDKKIPRDVYYEVTLHFAIADRYHRHHGHQYKSDPADRVPSRYDAEQARNWGYLEKSFLFSCMLLSKISIIMYVRNTNSHFRIELVEQYR